MAKDLAILVEDRPGQAVAVFDALGQARIKVEGTYGSGREGIVHVLVQDVAAARQALAAAGLEVRDEHEVLVLSLVERPGDAADVLRRLAQAGVNVDFYYVATHTRLVIGVDDLEKARAAMRSPQAGRPGPA